MKEIPYSFEKPLDMASLAIYTLEQKDFEQEDEAQEEVREKKKSNKHESEE